MIQEKLDVWTNEVLRYNHRLHLVSSSMEKDFREHVEDCLYLLEHIQEPYITDLGSGSGLPAIPYKLIHPDSYIYMLERSAKKCTFLRHIVELLGLISIEAIQADALSDDIGRFDAIITRSFSPKNTLEKAVSKILSDEGRLYYMHTGDTLPALSDIFTLQGRISKRCTMHTLHLSTYIINPL